MDDRNEKWAVGIKNGQVETENGWWGKGWVKMDGRAWKRAVRLKQAGVMHRRRASLRVVAAVFVLV